MILKGASMISCYLSHVGLALKETRVLKGMEVWRLTAKIRHKIGRHKDIDQEYVCRVECGELSLTFRRFLLWCQVLEATPSFVLKTAECLIEHDQNSD